jgi:hypothetical protein
LGFGSTFYEYLPILLYFTLILGITIIGGLIFVLSKKFLIKPRIGSVKYGRKRKRRKWTTVLVLIINVIILLAIAFVLNSNLLDRDLIPDFIFILLIAIFFITLPMSLIAYLMQYPRFYFSAILFGIGVFLSEFLTIYFAYPLSNLISFSIVGTVILLLGLFYLRKFIMKYPKEDGK